MAEHVFCIDFGSAYTKVALRRHPAADSQLLVLPNVGIDFLIPSAVAVDRRTKPRVLFGDEAVSQIAGSGIDVYENWKKFLFLTPPPVAASQSPLETFLHSEELVQLAAKYDVPPGQITYLQQLVTAARALVGGPGDRVVSAESQKQARAANVAAHFFNWLRQKVLDACAKLPMSGLKFDEIPVRIAVPALNGGDVAQHPGCKLLKEALHQVGWPLHPERPFVAEPYSNAIGILTKASNALHRGRIHFGDMFGKGPLITVLKDTRHYPSYRALVIDIGAFTTDIAAISIKPDGNTNSDPDTGFVVNQLSIPFGVSDLDSRVRQALPKEKREWLEKAPLKEFATFQKMAYTDGKGIRPAGLGMVIGGEADRDVIETCLKEFSDRLVEEAAKFCASLEPTAMQELIFTGGGSNILVVREALQDAAQSDGKSFVKMHAPDIKRIKGGPVIDKLDEQFTRGGSALGGASIYFEKDYY
ncbi:MAG: hypothetical protein L0241_19650 [Planctomycetia bacterium]|nr:hypothetical protein [Planctomycetia bacterium]